MVVEITYGARPGVAHLMPTADPVCYFDSCPWCNLRCDLPCLPIDRRSPCPDPWNTGCVLLNLPELLKRKEPGPTPRIQTAYYQYLLSSAENTPRLSIGSAVSLILGAIFYWSYQVKAFSTRSQDPSIWLNDQQRSFLICSVIQYFCR